MVNQLNQNLAQRSITVTVADEAENAGSSIRHSTTAATVRVRCAARLQKYIEDPLSEALIQGTITTRPAFIEVFLDGQQAVLSPGGLEKAEGVLLYEN